MVELCELKMMPEVDEWPADMDQRVAQLDFAVGDSVLFESFDPSLSTDSLDSNELRERCAVRKDDFQLAFADSGHWQSGINANLTTWGRIRTTEAFDEKTASAPEVQLGEVAGSRNANGTTRKSASSYNNRNSEPNHNAARTTSLVANFVDRTSLDAGPRYVDMNENEVVVTTLLSEEEQRARSADRWQRQRPVINAHIPAQQAAATRPPAGPAAVLSHRSIVSAPAARTSPRGANALVRRRTFADLQSNVPELEFLALQHEMPNLCESTSMSLSDVIMKVKREGLPRLTSDFDLPIPNILQDDSPDSGIGCSGPLHIEDWASLSVLLPKHVAEACSFFKSNTQLLGSSSSNCIERSRRSEPCTTCFRVRRRLHPPVWAHSSNSKNFLCDCTASEIVENTQQLVGSRPTRSVNRRQSLRARELSIVGLPIYAGKRALVEAVVEGVAAVARDDGAHLLVVALKDIIEDGLKKDTTPWQMIKTLTAPGPATKHVYSIVRTLDSSEKSENSRVDIFFEELLRENSLDCWLCYVVLKENVLSRLYEEGAFLLAAPSAYRSLLWRLVDSLALLTVLDVRDSTAPISSRSLHHVHASHWSTGASRIASDSRVPKSSSVPARLSSSRLHPSASGNLRHIRPSRIPLPLSRPSMSRTLSPSRSPLGHAPLGTVLSDCSRPGLLPVCHGECVRVLSRRGQFARCVRLHPRRSAVSTGLVPISNLIIQ